MSEGNSLINLGELSKPATVLIKKISDAIGGIFRPYQIRRIAQAEAEAEKIKALSRIEISDLERRALQRVIVEEANRQHNIESITQKALPDLTDQAQPQNIENDWITNFFDKCRLISDEDMQALWAKLLAGEANSPGKYSRRTINLLESLDKSDAELFKSLSSFAWSIGGNYLPLIYDYKYEMYNDSGISFDSLKHMREIGLISFEEEEESTYVILGLSQSVSTLYYQRLFGIRFRQDQKYEMNVGVALFSKTGSELAKICGAEPNPAFTEYIVNKWRSFQYDVVEVQDDDFIEPNENMKKATSFSVFTPKRVLNVMGWEP